MFEEDFLMSATEKNIEKKQEEKQNKEKQIDEKINNENEKINFWEIKQSIYEKNKKYYSNCLTDFLD